MAAAARNVRQRRDRPARSRRFVIWSTPIMKRSPQGPDAFCSHERGV